MKIPALRRMFTYAGLLIIVPIFVFAIANYEATPARGVSTVADVVAYQKKAEETLAQIYRYCDHAVEVEERENGDLGYFGRTAFKGKCQRRMLGLDNASNGGAPSEPPGPNWGVLNLQQCYRLGALAWSALFLCQPSHGRGAVVTPIPHVPRMIADPGVFLLWCPISLDGRCPVSVSRLRQTH